MFFIKQGKLKMFITELIYHFSKTFCNWWSFPQTFRTLIWLELQQLCCTKSQNEHKIHIKKVLPSWNEFPWELNFANFSLFLSRFWKYEGNCRKLSQFRWTNNSNIFNPKMSYLATIKTSIFFHFIYWYSTIIDDFFWILLPV